jgi:hypothetical protein
LPFRVCVPGLLGLRGVARELGDPRGDGAPTEAEMAHGDDRLFSTSSEAPCSGSQHIGRPSSACLGLI